MATHAPPATTVARVAPSAVVWIDEREALLAAITPDGSISTCHIQRGDLPQPSYLAHVVRAIGDRERVVITGPGSMRLELEREYVALYRRPDRLVDVEPGDRLGESELVERARRLAA